MSSPRTVRIVVDEENPGTWFYHARKSLIPSCVAGLVRSNASGAETRVTTAQADLVREWCARIAGWEGGPPHAPHPLRFIACDDDAATTTTTTATTPGVAP